MQRYENWKDIKTRAIAEFRKEDNRKDICRYKNSKDIKTGAIAKTKTKASPKK